MDAQHLALAAGLVAVVAGTAVAKRTADGSDDKARLTFAEGTLESNHVRLVAGEVDGKGVVWFELYTDKRLVYVVPYTDARIDGEEHSVRDLHELRAGVLGSRGFELAATDGSEPLSCIVPTWSDSTIRCTRDSSWVPPGRPECSATFLSELGRNSCNVYRDLYPDPPMPHDELMQLCTRAFRYEYRQIECMRYGLEQRDPSAFRDVIDACEAAYTTQAERSFCEYYAFAPANVAERPTAAEIRACDRLHDDDKETTACVFEKHTGTKQVAEKPVKVKPGEGPTAPVNAQDVTSVSGGRIEVASGRWRDLSVRATGGTVGTEAVLWIDMFDAGGALRVQNVIDRIAIGKNVRSMREVTALGDLEMRGDVLTFRATHGGKQLRCRTEANVSYGTCRVE